MIPSFTNTDSCPTEMTTTTTTSGAPLILTISVSPTSAPIDSTSTSSGLTSGLLTTSITTSSSPPTGSPSSDSNTGGNTTVAIVAGVVVGLIACIVLVLLVIVICLLMKKYLRSKTELKKLQNAVCEQGVELKDAENDEGKADNPLYQSSPTDNGHQPNTNTTDCPLYQSAEVTNSAYYSVAADPLPAEDDPFYSIVDEDKKATLRALKNHGNDQNGSTLLPVPQLLSQSPAPQGAPPIYSSVLKELPPELSPQVPEICTEGDETDESTAIYSDIHEKAPLVPTKSEALEEYLATKDAGSRHNSMNEAPASKPSKIASLPQPFVSTMKENPTYESAEGNSDNADLYLYAQPDIPRFHPTPAADGEEGIYSEAITPAHFTRGDGGQRSGEKEGDAGAPQIYSSIYTIPATLPENLQRPLEVNSDNIIERKVLGIGQFGQVVLAYTNGLSMKDMGFTETESSWGASIQVAVKKLRPDHSKSQQEAFDKEIKFMSRLKHPNVVRFIGVCHRDPAFIMMEYMEEGDLSQFLQRYSEIVETPSNDKQISTSTVVHMASQIANAMKYLASLNFVHRDLACRNCLVGKNFTVKLADFGMSRNLYESHYYRIQGNAVLPIRWMATECFYGIFSEKTDVWSFGITMWELFTLGKNKPYPRLTDQEVINDATVMGKHRQLLSKPAACPESVYDVMQQCWAANPKKRIMFSAIDEMLQECQ